LEDAQAHQTQTLERAIGELSILEKNERELRDGVSVVEGKREWVEEFRGWVEMLGGFLEEKVSCCQTGLTAVPQT
jgi:GC-rich sequence DNA-binding factor